MAKKYFYLTQKGEALRLWLCPHHRQEVIPQVHCGHPGLPGPGGALPQCAQAAGLQPGPGHVVHRGHHLRQPVGAVPVQRGRGHRRPDQERPVHVPGQAVGVHITAGH